VSIRRKVKRAIAAFSAVLVGFVAIAVPMASLAATNITTSKYSSMNEYLGQTVKWNSCGTDLYCGVVSVPMDWKNLKGEAISLSVVFHRASVAKPLGSIIFNPGGPGASGYDFVKNNIADLATDKLKKQYNLVGFDPRGVQNSSAVSCFASGKAQDNFLYGDTGYSLGSAKDIAETKKLLALFSKVCAKLTGKLLGYVDTINAARDMDVLRAVMGDKKLNYLGFSYGTYLGNTYAALYPTKVGRMVLDGAIDPTVSQSVQSVNQLKGFDLALKDYLKDCLANSGCPFSGTQSAAESKIKKFLLGLETKPITSSDGNRKVTVWMALNGINMALYSDEYWQYLTAAFEQAFKGDGTTLQRLADFYNDRSEDGTYSSNQNEANVAINCLDARESSKAADMKVQNKRMIAASNVFGRYWQFGGLACYSWKYPAVKPLKSYAAKGSPTIVVIGTTGDPATPYGQAVSLAHKVLARGYLITFQGEGHTAYGRSGSCVDNAVDNFFIYGALASTEPVCK
jgi:pimeloyl-ACP methyl ester carboxylesterase